MNVAMDTTIAVFVLSYLFVVAYSADVDIKKENLKENEKEKDENKENNQKKRQLSDISNGYFNLLMHDQLAQEQNYAQHQLTFQQDYEALLTQQNNENKGIPRVKNLKKVYVFPKKGKSQYNTMAPQVHVAPVKEDTREEDEKHQRNEQQQQQQQPPQQQRYIYLNLIPQSPYTEQSENTLHQQQLFFPEHHSPMTNFHIRPQMQLTENQNFQFIPFEYNTEHKLPEYQSQQTQEEGAQQQEHKPFLHLRLLPLVKYEYKQDQSENSENLRLNENYAPQYNGDQHKATSDLMEKIHLSKLKAQAHAEAIANSPPVVVHKDITITKRKPINIFKTVHVPIPTPILIPFPQPYKHYIPQPYAVPMEILRPYYVNVEKTEKVEVEKPVPVEVEKIVHVPVEKKVYYKVEKPVTVERKVPVEVRKEIPVEIPIYKPEKFTIVRHIWEH